MLVPLFLLFAGVQESHWWGKSGSEEPETLNPKGQAGWYRA